MTRAFNHAPSFAHVLAERAQASPDALAITFRATPDERVCYGELHLRAGALAQRLREVTRPGDRAVLLLPPGLDYVAAFFGCLYAGVVAVPTYPPLDSRQLPRLVSMMVDAAPSAVLTLSGLMELAREPLDQHGLAGSMTWLAVDEIGAVTEVGPLRSTRPDEIAFLQYTSGSTSSPKGTIITHGNLLDNSEAVRVLFGHSTESVGVIWLPPYHDMGLIGGVLQPIYAGFPVVLMSPLDLLASPRTWLAAISDYGATTSGGPNFAFDLCVRKIGPEQREGLDLSSWSVAFCGAEPVRRDTLDRFVEAFGPHGFSPSAWYPCYGLAESTLIAAGGVKGAGLTVHNGSVSCGTAIPGHQLRVLALDGLAPLADGEIGEICVQGPSVAHGYWNAPDTTAEGFVADAAGRRWLRTGDLGYLIDGELHVTGRLKDVVIVRGRNLAAEDVEHAVTGCHPMVRPGAVAAFEVDLGGESGLAVLAELAGRVSDDALREIVAAVQQAVVAAFGVRAERILLARRGSIPKTSSGKIRRSDTRARYLAGELSLFTDEALAIPGRAGADPRRAELARRIADLAARVLELPAGSITVDSVLTAAGLDSLRAVELGYLAGEELGVRLSLRDLLVGASPTQLAAQSPDDVEKGDPEGSGLEPTELVVTDDLSDGERGLWLASRISGNKAHYVLNVELELRGEVDVPALERSVRYLADRHRALRTYFPEADGEPRRRPHPQPLSLRVVDVEPVDVDRQVAECGADGIDPTIGPLWRLTLVRGRGADKLGVLVLCVHHMACDVWSLDLLAQELGTAYDAFTAGQVPGLPAAGDPARLVARHARRLAAAPTSEGPAAFWRDALADLPPSAALPAARPHRPAAAPAQRRRMVLPSAVVDQVQALVRDTGATPYTVLLTSFAWLLYRYSAERRFVLGMPAAGRLDAESASAVGYFVNPLPLVCDIDPAADFRTHLRTLGGRIADAQANQEFPYQRMLETCVPSARSRDLIRILLLQQQVPGGHALALLGGGDGADARLGDLDVRMRSFSQRTAPFELTVEIVQTTTGLACSLTYDTVALTRTDVEAFGAHWARMLERVTADPTLRPGEVDILTTDERHLLLDGWQPRATVDGPTNIVDAVLEVGLRQPDAVAVRDESGRLTFAELDRRSAALAADLIRRGVVDERPVGLLMPRSVDLVVAILATMRAGSPYVPLDIDHPDPRLVAVLDDAGVAAVITTADLAGSRAILAGRVVVVEDPTADAGPEPLPPLHPDRLAHLIYTSGSTGTPKGVACGHRGVVNLVADFRSRVSIGPGDRCGWWTSPGFDVSVHEVFSALTAGATVEVCPADARNDAHALMKWLTDRKITGAYLPPHLLPDLADLLAHERRRVWLTWLLVGVEPIPEPLLHRIAGLVPGLVVINGYGPTESTVWALFHQLETTSTEPGITALGKGVANCPVYLLDEALRPVPVGALGEIHIGGVALARGYHGRPGQTAERFVPSPWDVGGRLYRTGDVARRRPNGDLVFVGRSDHQAKVRGMRIEPREIETAMVEHPAVIAAVVVVSGRPPSTRLIGYARVASDRLTDAALVGDLGRHLRSRLPGPMVPGQLVLVEEWPMTINGKIDRSALPPPGPVTASPMAPIGEVESAIAAIWSERLELPAVGRMDDFFQLGGHSLLAARVSADLALRLNIAVEPCHVMDHPTVADLAAAIASMPPAEPSVAGASVEQALLDHIVALPAEADAYLARLAEGDQP